MSGINYYSIQEEMKDIFDQSERIIVNPAPNVIIEDDVVFGSMGNINSISIYLTNRSLASGQVMSAGRQTRYNLTMSVWVWSAGVDVQSTIKIRDDMLNQVELTLMANRTLNDKVEMLWLDGGEFMSTRNNPQRFITGAELIVKIDAFSKL